MKNSSARKLWLDYARGMAVMAMILYHFTWDLSFHQLIETDVTTSLFWKSLARAIAASFLFLSGISLYLAHGAGIRWNAYLRRLVILLSAAALVTLGTWYQFPDSYVFFGILHCLALCSIVALVFLRLPWVVTVVAAILSFAAPYYFINTIFDAPYLAFLGLRTLPIRSNDFVPLLPWISPMLLGVGLAQLTHTHSFSLSWVILPAWLKKLPPLKPLLFLGRHSLIIYLIHQPVLFSLTAFAAGTLVSKVDAETGSFISACETICVAQGKDKQTCIETCFCTVDGLKATGIWPKMISGQMDNLARTYIAKMAEVCRR